MAKTGYKKKSEKVDFILVTYEIIMESIFRYTRLTNSKIQIRTMHENINRYIHLERYGQSIALYLYSDGKIVIELEEMFHRKHKEVLFDYVRTPAQKEVFWSKLKELLSWLIREFLDLEKQDFHAYMDYVGKSETLVQAYKRMKARNATYDVETKEAVII